MYVKNMTCQSNYSWLFPPRETFVQQHHVPQAQIKVKTKKDNVAGVNLPNFEAFQVLAEEQIHLVF